MAAPSRPAGKGTGRGDKEVPKTAPRDYIVMRELKLSELVNLNPDDAQALLERLGGADAAVLVELGHAQARTPKEARRNVAKEKLDEAELSPEGGGVALNAVPARALTSGRGVVKMRNEPKWDD